ncbi:MAG: hypothetical protein AB7U82_06910 [Blastocatellales bacterium]
MRIIKRHNGNHPFSKRAYSIAWRLVYGLTTEVMRRAAPRAM